MQNSNDKDPVNINENASEEKDKEQSQIPEGFSIKDFESTKVKAATQDTGTNSDDNAQSKKRSSGGFSRKFTLLSIKLTIAAISVLAIIFIYISVVVREGFDVDDKWVLPAVVYSRPLELYPESEIVTRADGL